MQVQILKTCDVNRNSDCDLRSSVALLSDRLYQIIRCFHGAFEMGVAWQQGMLTLPDTWFRPFLTCICSYSWDQFFPKLVIFRTFHFKYPCVHSRFCTKHLTLHFPVSSWYYKSHILYHISMVYHTFNITYLLTNITNAYDTEYCIVSTNSHLNVLLAFWIFHDITWAQFISSHTVHVLILVQPNFYCTCTYFSAIKF